MFLFVQQLALRTAAHTGQPDQLPQGADGSALHASTLPPPPLLHQSCEPNLGRGEGSHSVLREAGGQSVRSVLRQEQQDHVLQKSAQLGLQSSRQHDQQDHLLRRSVQQGLHISGQQDQQDHVLLKSTQQGLQGSGQQDQQEQHYGVQGGQAGGQDDRASVTSSCVGGSGVFFTGARLPLAIAELGRTSCPATLHVNRTSQTVTLSVSSGVV